MRLNFQKKPDDSIRFLITKEEKEFIKKKANESNMDMSNFIKFCVNFYLEKENQKRKNYLYLYQWLEK